MVFGKVQKKIDFIGERKILEMRKKFYQREEKSRLTSKKEIEYMNAKVFCLQTS